MSKAKRNEMIQAEGHASNTHGVGQNSLQCLPQRVKKVSETHINTWANTCKTGLTGTRKATDSNQWKLKGRSERCLGDVLEA